MLSVSCREKDPKMVYYLSAEFLMGRSLTNAVYNLKLEGEYKEALQKLGYSLEQLQASFLLTPLQGTSCRFQSDHLLMLLYGTIGHEDQRAIHNMHSQIYVDCLQAG